MKQTITKLVVLALVVTGAWYGWTRLHPTKAAGLAGAVKADAAGKPAAKAAPVVLAQPVDLTQHDGQTIDFSSGKPVVKDSPEDKAALEAAAKDLAAASNSVTFEPVKKK